LFVSERNGKNLAKKTKKWVQSLAAFAQANHVLTDHP